MVAKIAIHESQFPAVIRQELLECLQARKVNHKFHYDSIRQTQKWLNLHQAYSPSRTDPDCAATYRQSFIAAAGHLKQSGVHLVGLGCGGGQKDTALLGLLKESTRQLFYTPSDVSVAMVLTARQSALAVVPEEDCFPFVCDLATAQDLPSGLAPFAFESIPAIARESFSLKRLFTFFGMLPNFESDAILSRLSSLVCAGDYLLVSANLAPGSDYSAGVGRVLPLYDNDLTRDWLMTFLLDLGIEHSDGTLCFGIEEPAGQVQLRRIAAYFHFTRDRVVEVDLQRFEFKAGESIRLFFSYRHTPALAQVLLEQYDFKILDQWITPSQEEGVFLAARI
jgi:uncharacterized SAM-dependent methyltransferase